MLTKFRGTVAAFAIAVLALSACSASASDDDITLSVNYPVSEQHAATEAFHAFAEEVTERTDGAVTFDHNYNAALCELPAAIECVGNGTVDIGFATHAYTPELSLANLSSTAFLATDLQAAADAHNQLHQESAEYTDEFDDRGVDILFHLVNMPPLVALADPIESLAELEGMSVRASGSMASAMEGLGANAVATDPAEIYESVERGVVQGLVLPLDSIVDLRLHEVAPHIYDIGEYVGIYAMSAYAINQSVWEGLPEDVQQVMMEVAAEISPTVTSDFLVPFTADTCLAAADDGAIVEAIGPAERGEQWRVDGREAQLAAWIEGAERVADPQSSADAYIDLYNELAGEPTPPTHQICGDVE